MRQCLRLTPRLLERAICAVRQIFGNRPERGAGLRRCAIVICALVPTASLKVCSGTVAVAARPSLSVRKDEPITPIPAPPTINPLKVKLGERLFSDRRLSHDNSRSCASCHDIATNGASPRQHDVGPDGAAIRSTRSPSSMRRSAFGSAGKENYRNIESRYQGVAGKPTHHGEQLVEIAEKLNADPDMRESFFAAYGRRPERGDVVDALANFQRTLVTPGGRFDRWLAGDAAALSDGRAGRLPIVQIAGLRVLPSGRQYRRQSVPAPRHIPSAGIARAAILRVPSLRNVATTPPYFHDGSAPTLDDAVRKMALAQLNAMLTDKQVTAIVAFLHSLTGNYRGTPVGGSAMKVALAVDWRNCLLALLTWLLLNGLNINSARFDRRAQGAWRLHQVRARDQPGSADRARRPVAKLRRSWCG